MPRDFEFDPIAALVSNAKDIMLTEVANKVDEQDEKIEKIVDDVKGLYLLIIILTMLALVIGVIVGHAF